MAITYEEFVRIDLRCGTIIKAEKFLRATKPAYKIWAAFVSNFLLVGFSDNNGAICLASVDLEIPNGNKLH